MEELRKINNSSFDMSNLFEAQDDWAMPFDDHLAVSLKEGIVLGHVINIFMDMDARKISAFEFRKNFWGNRYFVLVEDIVFIGNEIIFVDEEKSIMPIEELDRSKFRSLKIITDSRVVTIDGKFLGKLEDIDVDSKTFVINRLFLDTNYSIKIDGGETIIGEDEIIIPSEFEHNLERNEKLRGILSLPIGKGLLSSISKRIELFNSNNKQKETSEDENNEQKN